MKKYETGFVPLDCIQNRPDLELPVWMFCDTREAFLIDSVPKNDNATRFNIFIFARTNKNPFPAITTAP